MTTSDSLDFDRNTYIRLKAGSKRPLDGGWGSKDEDTFTRLKDKDVRSWVEEGGNVAVLTGKRSGHFSIDVDPKNGGKETFDALEREGFEFPLTHTVTTPSGGFHLNYAYPEGFERVHNDTAGKVLGAGIDIKGDFGYRVAPPSHGASGAYVESGEEQEYREAPEWLLDRLRARADKKAERAADGPYEAPEKAEGGECCVRLSGKAVDALTRLMDELRGLKEGERLEVLGEDRGWDDGFWLLATRLVEVALWPYSEFDLDVARDVWIEHSPDAEGSFDPDHVWERALESASEWTKGQRHRTEAHVTSMSLDELVALGMGEQEVEEAEALYQFSPTIAPYKFTEEFIDREFRHGTTYIGSEAPITLRFNDDRNFWLWDDVHSRYRVLNEDQIRARVSLLIRNARTLNAEGEAGPVNLKARTVGEVIEALRSDCGENAPRLLPCVGGVPFKNGWLNIGTKALEPIGPERDVRWNVPLAYSPNAGEPTAWLAFLDSLGWAEGSEERRLLRQWFGYLLSGRTEQQKAMLLLGPKRAGKGTILKVAKGMLGLGAVGTQLDKLASEFGMQNLIGASLVTIGDARFGTRTPAALVERILSMVSDDEMTVNVKYGKPLNLRMGIRLMIATNEMPNFIEASDAIASRFLVLRLTETFYGHEDLRLEQKVIRELPGIVRWALNGLVDLDGLGSFEETEAGREVQRQMIMDSAPIRVFVEECCELGKDFRIENDKLYQEYRLWAEQNGMFVLNSVKFARDLLTAYPSEVRNGNFKRSGKSVRAKYGIRMGA